MKQVKFAKSMLLFLSLFVSTAFAAAQITVTGKVTEATGDPIIGATVMVVNTATGTVTDVNGNYSVKAMPDAQLTFSFIGYTSQTISVNGQTTINVVLESESETLGDVVVIGYGTAKRSDISGSVTSVDTKEMLKKMPVNLAQGLQGAAAGVMVTSQDGAPDANAAIRIRGVGTINGSADPLYVVDGVQVGTNANFINPHDIQSIEILKDASATAIYGSRGANGVVMITTKRGSKGSVHVDVAANWGVQTLQDKLETLDADTYAKAIRTARANDGSVPVLAVWDKQYDGKRKTIDWQDEMTRVSLRQNYAVSASGGTDKVQGLLSVGYLDNEGIVLNTDFKRMTVRSSFKANVNKYLEVGGDLNFTHSESKGSNAALGNDVNLSSLRDYATAVPTMDYVKDGKLIHPNVKNANGTYGTFEQSNTDTEIMKGYDNFVARQSEVNNPVNNNNFLTNAYVDITPVKGLRLRSILSYAYNGSNSSTWVPLRPRFNEGERITLVGIDNVEEFSLSQSAGYTKGIETYITYNLETDMHSLSVMAGNSVQRSWGEWVNASAKDFPASTIRDLSLTNNLDSKTGGGAFNLETRFISYYGRLMYSLMDRYNLTATVRRDGSSNFGSGNRWGVFPSFAASWRLSEEEFMQGQDIFSNVKVRFGWGQTGNAGEATDLATPQLNAGFMYRFYTPGASTQGFSTANGLAAGTVIDTNLKWETNEQTNVGLDFGVMGGDVTVALDYFVRKSKDLLLYQSLRPSTGWNNVYTNYGEIRNQGFEFSVNWNHMFGNGLRLGATVTGSTLKNEIIQSGLDIMNTCDRNDGVTMGDNSNMGTVEGSGMGWNNHSICREGYAVGSYFGYRTDGLIKSKAELDKLNAMANSKNADITEYQVNAQPGDVKYKDLNGDGHIDEQDMDVIGNGFPKFNFGLNINASFKNWDMAVYTYGVLGQDILSYSAMRLSTMKQNQGIANILSDVYGDVWTEQNPNASLPRLSILDKNINTRCSDMWVKKGDFFKISNIQLGYTVPADVLNPLGITSARVYASVSNVFTFSGYKKYGDPECGQGSVLWTGLDTGRYPNPRTFALGLSVQF